MQIDAALYDDQTETRAWTVSDVTSAMEGVKEPLSIGFWNSDPFVADGANCVWAGTADFESDSLSSVRIFRRVS